MCWGYNGYGQLGDGTTTNRLLPVKVLNLAAKAVQVSVGLTHSCALLENGAIQCWGDNRNGELGDGTTTGKALPVTVSGYSTGGKKVATGSYYTCAIKANGGALQCWGYNGLGNLGVGNTTNRNTPTDVTNMSSGVTHISLSSHTSNHNHTCAIKAGVPYCWGYNGYGGIGDNTTIQRNIPTGILGLSGNVIDISVGSLHTCALTSSGGVLCWGYGPHGQLGDGTTTSAQLTFVPVTGLSSGIQSVQAGELRTCALTKASAVVCWGYNAHGQVGDGTTTQRNTPVPVSGLTSGIETMAIGGYHACAPTPGGAVKCWGYNAHGQLGDGTTTNRTTPVFVK
jgi:alpha-tubulin suppressor-like RCC1 family protein